MKCIPADSLVSTSWSRVPPLSLTDRRACADFRRLLNDLRRTSVEMPNSTISAQFRFVFWDFSLNHWSKLAVRSATSMRTAQVRQHRFERLRMTIICAAWLKLLLATSVAGLELHRGYT